MAREKILVVEDEPDILELITFNLLKDGYQVKGISSGEEARAFKPSPAVYELGIKRAGCAREDILWVTGHQWEAFGAVRQNLRVAWTNRAREPRLQIGIEPTYTTRNLQELADILAAEAKR